MPPAVFSLNYSNYIYLAPDGHVFGRITLPAPNITQDNKIWPNI